MTTPDQARAIAAGLDARMIDGIFDDERTPLMACQLNALELVHIDVVKDAMGELVDMNSRLTPLGLAVRSILQEQSNG